MDSQHVVLLSIIYQLLDHGADIGGLNPNVQEYLHGLVDEFNSADPEDQKYYDAVYNYADTFFNSHGGKGKLH